MTRASGKFEFESAEVTAARRRLADIRARLEKASSTLASRYSGAGDGYQERVHAEARADTSRLEQQLPIAERELADAEEAARRRLVEARLAARPALLRVKLAAQVAAAEALQREQEAADALDRHDAETLALAGGEQADYADCYNALLPAALGAAHDEAVRRALESTTNRRDP